MKTALAIFFLSIHLVGNTEAGQVLRLSKLIEHYNYHHQTDPGIGFIRFLIMHYAGDDGTNKDDQQDSKLPCHDPAHSSVTVVFTPMVFSPAACTPPPGFTPGFTDRHFAGIHSKYVGKLLQPPR